MRIDPKKSLGQNFLINRGVVEKIIRAADLKKDDTVLEIGPGTGILTEKLVSQVDRLIAVEKDSRLIAPLSEKFPQVEVIEDNILSFKIENLKLKIGGYKVIGNIPYYLTSRLFRIIFETWPQPQLMLFMVQKEVARRIMATPPHMNLLALSVQFFSTPEIIADVSRGSFRPMPNVDSAVVKITPKKINSDKSAQKALFALMRAGFSSKRKQLAGNLAAHLSINKAAVQETLKNLGISEDIRAENLSLQDWIILQKAV
ncbi:MAG: 16S rRNA (adenine(1518)-N(6)/adenine(1519)-N(6))-dimethyltransferase RsmA [Candidatus Yanofskybacteria bacterium]|nr:16S rRNA (adenine(1518)-N(6)/adenine(1519)-N(6))-dimethyltransferase RsmA [Candidatus Yanofskybacteria bacterium]